jgi:uncharacterized OsmC-like protein
MGQLETLTLVQCQSFPRCCSFDVKNADDEMTNSTKIREIAERNARTLALKPTRGHLTGVTKARIVDGLRCEIEEGPWKLAADMPLKAGGSDTAPTPGMLGRGALASCLAIGISVWAARLGTPIDVLEVEVQADFDARGELGVGERIPPGYQEVRYLVSIDSPASEEALAELLETAERHSPYVDIFSRAQTMRRVLRLNGKEV